jgi:hypothetical protein
VWGAGYVVICLFFGLAGGVVGRVKGSSFILWFVVSAVVPFIGLLTAVCYPRQDRELRRACPRCRQILKLHDAKCMRCGQELEYPEQVIASEATMRSRTA